MLRLYDLLFLYAPPLSSMLHFMITGEDLPFFAFSFFSRHSMYGLYAFCLSIIFFESMPVDYQFKIDQRILNSFRMSWVLFLSSSSKNKELLWAYEQLCQVSCFQYFSGSTRLFEKLENGHHQFY
jgi:hypothetical protein